MRLALAIALLSGLLAAACLEQAPVETRDIVSTIPWPDEERLEYVVLERNGEDVRGEGTLSIERIGDEFELRAEFSNEEASDDTVMRVDAETLKPRSVHKELRDQDERQVLDATYNTEEGILEITQIIDGEETSRPARLDEEHYYDNDTSAFLWRTIAFREGYEAYYHSVLANQGGDHQLLKLEVVGKEEVEVPAGRFNAWKLEISTPRGLQTAWFTDTPQRIMVRYDTTRNILELKSLPE